MAITVDSSKAKIVIKDSASASASVFMSKAEGSRLVCTHLKNGFMPGPTFPDIKSGSKDAFTATATVPVSATVADLPELKKWNFGFIQFQHIGSLMLYYAGPSSSDGELLVQANIPAAMAYNHGRDHDNDPNSPWLRVGTTGDLVFDIKTGLVTVTMGDHPMCGVSNELTNRKTKSSNYLRRMIDSRTFHTIFCALDPQGNYMHLAHFKWVCNWDYEFQWRGGKISSSSSAGSTNFKVDTPKSGAPTDSKIVAFLKAPKTAPKLGTNEQSAALKNSIIGPPNRIDQESYFGTVSSNFYQPK